MKIEFNLESSKEWKSEIIENHLRVPRVHPNDLVHLTSFDNFILPFISLTYKYKIMNSDYY